MTRKSNKSKSKPRPQKPKKLAKREEGPLARREDFVAERFSQLVPRLPDDLMAAAAALPALTEETSSLPAKLNRQTLVHEYRARQQAHAIVSPPLLAAATAVAVLSISSSEAAQPPSAQDQKAANELFGVESEADPDKEAEEAEPPAPPLPPPANNWVPIGPSVVRRGQGDGEPSTSGRVMGMAVASDGNRVFVAASNGGVWRSDDEGHTWRSLMDAWDLNPTAKATDSLSCGAIAIDSANPDHIFVGSGDGDEALFLGVGPIVSTDGGINWISEPSAPGSPSLVGSAMNAIVVDPTLPDRVIAGTFQGLYRREPNLVGGFHWVRKGSPSGRITSVVAAQAGGVTTFYAAPATGPVFSSNDGDIWTPIGTGFPPTGVGRVGLAVCATDPNVVYALVAAVNGSVLGIWRLDVGAGQWHRVNGHPADLFGTAAIGFQGTYDLALAIDPNNENLLYIGGSTRQSGLEWSGCVYRCAISSNGTGTTLNYTMIPTYVGGRVHADSHCLVFAPGDSNKLWLGCDGGVFYSTNPGDGDGHFAARNTGLQTLEMNRLAQHPTEDAVVFCGTQDNGGVRYTGEEAWYHSVWGDCGDFVINWADPYRVLATYVGKSVNRSINGGTRYNYKSVSIPNTPSDSQFFYAPLETTPPATTLAEAERVAFGSRRIWISETFGGGWTSIPNGANTDDLGSRVRALRFAAYDKLYAATEAGGVFRFIHANGAWSLQRIDDAPGGTLGLSGVITSIAIDPADPTGDSLYVTFGGQGNYQHVWHFNGTRWEPRSGASAAALTSLLDVQHSTIVCDPFNLGTLYVGADIGVWRSTDHGMTWSPYSDGLPDAGVLDLELHNNRRLLRAATYGRGVYEINLNPPTSTPGIHLFVRDTQLDQGRFASVNGLADPTNFGEIVRHWRGPDIKVDTPDNSGQYQFPITPGTSINFEQFTNVLTDDFRNVATPAAATVTTRVYVQVHNRGVMPADNVRVMLLLTNASAGLPALPPGFAAHVQSGTPINTAQWKTIGFDTVSDVRVGFPKIAAFNLTSDLLPPPSSLSGNNHFCVLALLHHDLDPFDATQTVVDVLSPSERKAAHKSLTVVQFSGTLPLMMPFRLHNPLTQSEIVTTLRITVPKFSGRVRLYMPKLQIEGALKQVIEGGKLGQDFEDFLKMIEMQNNLIKDNLSSANPYNREWSTERSDDLKAALEGGVMLELSTSGHKPFVLGNIKIAPATHHTCFLLFDRPSSPEGSFFPLEIEQYEARKGHLIGGLSARLEVLPINQPK